MNVYFMKSKTSNHVLAKAPHLASSCPPPRSRLHFEASELENRSLTDSDLFAQQSFLIREARKTLELGKSVGFQFHGPEDEIVREIAQLEESSREIVGQPARNITARVIILALKWTNVAIGCDGRSQTIFHLVIVLGFKRKVIRVIASFDDYQEVLSSGSIKAAFLFDTLC
ncbi:hypothetical protein GQ457_14G003620 [Hibiscus cannabinus]